MLEGILNVDRFRKRRWTSPIFCYTPQREYVRASQPTSTLHKIRIRKSRHVRLPPGQSIPRPFPPFRSWTNDNQAHCNCQFNNWFYLEHINCTSSNKKIKQWQSFPKRFVNAVTTCITFYFLLFHFFSFSLVLVERFALFLVYKLHIEPSLH